jgi:hypothetical protein
VSALFGFLPIEFVKLHATAVYAALFDLLAAPVKGFVDGVMEMLPTMWPSFDFLIPMRPLVPIVTIIGLGIIMSVIGSLIVSEESRQARSRDAIPEFNRAASTRNIQYASRQPSCVSM